MFAEVSCRTKFGGKIFAKFSIFYHDFRSLLSLPVHHTIFHSHQSSIKCFRFSAFSKLFKRRRARVTSKKCLIHCVLKFKSFFLRLNMASSGHRGNIREVVQKNGSHHTGFCNTETVRKELYEESCMNIDSRPGARVKRRFLCVSY